MADVQNQNGQTDPGAGAATQVQQTQTQSPPFDYDKLASLIQGKQTVAEDTVLKNYFKQQGMSEEEIDDEILWSEDSGRTLDGEMIADVVAQKKTLTITWGFLTDEDVEKIRQYMLAGFFVISFCGISITTYRGTLTSVLAGEFAREIWHKSVSVKVVQK